MTLKTLRLETVGSTGEVYEINLYSDGEEIRLTCTCLNGTFDDTCYCKHRKSVIDGTLERFLEIPPDAQTIIKTLLSQATWLATHKEIVAMEAELKKETARKKRKIAAAKIKVATAMNGRDKPK